MIENADEEDEDDATGTESDCVRAWNELVSLEKYDCYYRVPIFKNLPDHYDLKIFMRAWFLLNGYGLPEELFLKSSSTAQDMKTLKAIIKENKNICRTALINTLYKCQIYYKNFDEFTFNIAIPFSQNIFKEVFNFVVKFELLDKEKFHIMNIVDLNFR